MKKCLMLLLGLAYFTPTMAQQWRIAPTVGINGASVTPSDAYKASLNSGGVQGTFGLAFRWQIGAMVDYAISERFSLRSGLFYTPKGSSVTFKNPQTSSITITGSLKTHYLEVPLLVSVAVGQKGFRLVGGPVFGVALSGRFVFDPVVSLGKTVYEGSIIDFTVGSKATDGLLPTETSLMIGLIRERERFGLPIEIGLYSQFGLSNWDPGVVSQPSHTIRNGLVGLKIAYFFEVGR